MIRDHRGKIPNYVVSRQSLTMLHQLSGITYQMTTYTHHEMRKAIKGTEVHRNHRRIGKCKYCSRRSDCPERLDIDENKKQ